MTDLNLIKKEFMILSGKTEDEAEYYSSVMEAQAEYVASVIKDTDDENCAQIVFLCAARAFYQMVLSNQSDGINSFSAGDISYSVDSSSAVENARAIYEFALAECSSKLENQLFAFEAI